jgi:hypothetical protein
MKAEKLLIRMPGKAEVEVSPTEFVQCQRADKPVDVAVCENIPARLNCPRLDVRPVPNPPKWDLITLLSARFTDDGKLKTPTFNVRPGHFQGFDPRCGPSTNKRGSYPCGDASGSYNSFSGDSGGAVFDGRGNLIGIHCSGHDMKGGESNHNHFQTLYGLGLKKVKAPLN